MSINSNLQELYQILPPYVTLVAVSKTHPPEKITEAYDFGHRVFGENKAQELADKYEKLPKDIKWHMIGHLQSNKVKYIAGFVSLIHSVDRMKLVREIDKRARENERVIDCLLQVHIADEKSKFGFTYEALTNILKEGLIDECKNVRVVGLMGMATFTEDEEQIKSEFSKLKEYFQEVKSNFYNTEEHFVYLSMGMSSDYKIALEEGSNMVRIGSAIFGERNYAN